MAGDDGGTKTQRLQLPFGTSSSSNAKQQQPLPMSQFDVPQLTMPQFRGQIRQISPNSAVENSGKRVGIPPTHPQIPPVSPYSQIPASRPGNQQPGLQNFGSGPRPSHARSMSQPLFFATDSLPPLSPSPYREVPSNSASDHVFTDVAMEERNENLQSALPPSPFTRCNSSRIGEGLPPRKAHRRSNSDIPFGFSSAMQTSPPLAPLRSPGALDRSVSVRGNSVGQPVQLVKRESSWEREGDDNAEVHGEQKPEGEVVDDLFSAYMNLENIDALNSSGADEKLGNKTQEDLDSRASGSRTNGGDSSDNEATSSVNESGSVPHDGMYSLPTKREGIKRNAGEDIAPTSRHYRSFSMDSFMDKLNYGDDSPKMPQSPGTLPGQASPANSIGANSNAFNLEFGNGEFTGAELKKIMANDKLTEIALSDPKRAKRILANRQSAARSKERKMRYISELELKVQTLQTEATTLSAQLTMLQRDSTGLSTQNNELRFRLQAMEQQAHLRDALNQALTAEVQRLKLATAAASGDPSKLQQLSESAQMFLRHQQQATQLNVQQLPQQQQQQALPQTSQSQQSSSTASAQNESSQ